MNIKNMSDQRDVEKKKEALDKNITIPHYEAHKDIYDRLRQVPEIDATADIRKLMQERLEYLASLYLSGAA